MAKARLAAADFQAQKAAASKRVMPEPLSDGFMPTPPPGATSDGAQ
jgi:hypothetical protein